MNLQCLNFEDYTTGTDYIKYNIISDNTRPMFDKTIIAVNEYQYTMITILPIK